MTDAARVLLPALRPVFTGEDVTRLIELRRDLHRHPELSWQEERTARRLADVLASLGAVEITRPARTGVVARFAGRDRAAPVVAVRGDIDALPIDEATGLPFASATPGVMHACGHDIHATWAIGAALLLARSPATGDVLVVLQPAEEVGEGAKAILETGALEDARAIFGGHVDRRFAVGEVVAEAGPLAASADSFEIELTGTGAHGARPHESADPIVGAAALVGALQTIVSRRLDPAAAAVVTVGTLHAGTAPNVIPETAVLTGTLRATTPETRTAIGDEVRRLAESVAAAYRLSARVVVHWGTPPIVNPPGPARWARHAVMALLGERAVVPFGVTNMGGEDFAFYLERIPGCFMRIGAREEGGARLAAHSPRFTAAEESIFVGAAVLAESARVASAALRKGAES
ncbi:MAG TPA: M20 family metallopeptidase [Gemmatimonadaceae bacterium]|nr:M20 family metallopeptidase [Gemmatimonadaceae bacterium]